MQDHFGRGFDYAPHHHWVGPAIMFVLFAVLIGVIIWAVIRTTRMDTLRRAAMPAGPPPSPLMAAEDAALSALRMRYAQGEIDRDEFVRVASDLGMPPPPSPEGQ